jgi:tetratricopeptide (TPR) repeat protein
MDVQRYLADEPVQACPPSAGYRLRKLVRRNKARLAISACLFLAVTVMAASIGWAVRDRAARLAESKAAETARLERVEGQVRDSYNAARALVADNRLSPARQKLAEARAQLGNDRAALGDLAAEVEASEAELDRFQRFLDLIDRAHEAETAPLVEAVLAADGSQSRVRTRPSASTRDRQRAAAALLRLEGLERYAILERDDWSSTLEGGLLGRYQIEQIRRAAYEELFWLANDVQTRRREHRTAEQLSLEAAARRSLAYLGKAESVHPATQAFYVLRARGHKALGDEAAAQADQQRANETAPTIALDQQLQGLAAYDAKQLAEAVAAFEAALRLDPTHYWSLMSLGTCLADLGRGPEDFAGSARVVTGCILKRPDHAHAYYCRAVAYGKLRRYLEALADGSKAIELDPKYAAAWSNRGVTYFHLGDPEKAIANCSRAVELDPKNALAWSNRGAAYANLGQWDKALADALKAIELDPTDPGAWNNRGAAYGALGQPGKAIADCSKAIALDLKLADAWANRGSLYGRLGQHDKVVADCSQAIALDPKLADAWGNRGAAYSKLGQLDKAIADCSESIELDPKNAQVWTNRGVAYRKLGQLDKAVADLSKSIELDPKQALVWNYRGGIYCDQLAQYDKALADFSRATELDPKLADAWYNRGNAYRNLGKLDKAIADYSKAIELEPKYASAWGNRGLAYSGLGQWDKAVLDLSQFINLAPNHPWLVQVYLLRAGAHSRLAHFAQARTDYESALKRAPANASILNDLAWLLATCPDPKVRDPLRAVELSRKAVEAAPKAGEYWNTLGVANYRASDWKAAVTALEKSVELRQGGDAVDHLFLAMAHQQLSNRDQARKAYDHAVQWLEKNKKKLEQDKAQAEELRHFRTEAEEVLELKKK